MVDPKLGTKRSCEACEAKFYDLNKDPVICPKCGHSFDPMATVAASAPVRENKPAKPDPIEDKEDELEDDEDALSLDDMAAAESDDDDDEDEDEALAFSQEPALLDDEDDDDEESFLEEDEDNK